LSRSSRETPAKKAWARSSRNRNKVWVPLFGLLILVAGVGFLVLAIAGGGHHAGQGSPIPTGQKVSAAKLTDVVSGRQLSLDTYVGQKDTVIVGYMGFF